MTGMFFSVLWSNIKRSPFISLILFLQVFLTSFILFQVFFDQGNAELKNRAAQNSYAKYQLYYLTQTNYEDDEINRSMGWPYPPERSYSDYESFYDKVKSSENIKTAVQYKFGIYRNDPLPFFSFSNEQIGDYGYYVSGTTEGNYRLNAIAVDRDFMNYFGLVIDSGRSFSEEEFERFDPDDVPVILGYSYKKYLSVGDTFEGNFLHIPGVLGSKTYSNMTFRVIGFISKGQVFFQVGGSSDPVPYDTYILFPYVYKSLDELSAFYELHPEYCEMTNLAVYYLNGLGGTMMSLKNYFAEDEAHERPMYEEMRSILEETGLGKYYELITPQRTYAQFADSSDERNGIQNALLIIMLLFLILSMVFASVNNISGNIKTYAVHILNGATVRRIIMYALLENLIYLISGWIAGFVWFYFIYIVGFDYYNHPAFSYCVSAGSVTALISVLAVSALSFLFISIKLRRYSFPALIRNNEARKERSLPLYKAITFFLLMLTSVCITYASSYIWQINHIDKYQRYFYSLNAHIMYVGAVPTENAPETVIDYKVEGSDGYVIDRIVSAYFDPVVGPAVRGTFFKGNAETPELLSGRYFTEEEVIAKSGYVVVGKNVLDSFVEEKDGKRIFRFNEKEFEVIGVIGREGHETTIDDWAIFTLPTILGIYGTEGSYLVDAGSEEEVIRIIGSIGELSKETATFSDTRFTGWVDIGVSNKIFYLFIASALLMTGFFCIYYTGRIQYIMNVKKFLGYSKPMICVDAVLQFVSISLAAFVAGNGIMLLVSRSVLKDLLFFSSFQINLPVILLSFCALMLIAALFSAVAVYKAFRRSSRELKRG